MRTTYLLAALLMLAAPAHAQLVRDSTYREMDEVWSYSIMTQDPESGAWFGAMCWRNKTAPVFAGPWVLAMTTHSIGSNRFLNVRYRVAGGAGPWTDSWRPAEQSGQLWGDVSNIAGRIKGADTVLIEVPTFSQGSKMARFEVTGWAEHLAWLAQRCRDRTR